MTLNLFLFRSRG